MHCNLRGNESLFNLSAVTTAAGKRGLPISSSRVSFTTRRSFLGSASMNDGLVTESVQLSLYQLLGISESGSLVDIKQAYKQLARRYHPDVSPPGRVDEYTRAFIRVQEAYHTLSDPSRRAMYDSHMAHGIHLPFSARRRHQNGGVLELHRGEWKNRWQSQLSELKRRNVNEDAGRNSSWAARMRVKRNESSDDSG